MATRAAAIVDAVRSMRGDIHTAAAQVEGCQKLITLLDLDGESKRLAFELGAIEAAIGACAAHPEASSVQEAVYELVPYLVLDDARNQERAGEAGALDAILAVIKLRMKGDGDLVVSPLQALSQLVIHHAGNRKRAREAGAVEAIIETML